MKNNYKYILISVLMLLSINTLMSQIGDPGQNGEFLMTEGGEVIDDLDPWGGSSPILPVLPELGFGNISFGYNIPSANYAHSLIQEAMANKWNIWYNTQEKILKEEIESQLGQTFSNYTNARTAYFRNLEKNNVRKNAPVPVNKYKSKLESRVASRNRSIRNLKLLKLRENEIIAGNINNSSFGYLKYNNTPLNQITSINQISQLNNTEKDVFGNTDWPYVEDNNILNKLIEISNNNNLNHDIINELHTKQLNLYNGYELSWEKLDLMQLYLNNVRLSYALAERYIAPVDYGTSSFIENYAIKNKDGSVISPFHDKYYLGIVHQMISDGIPEQYAYIQAESYVDQERDAAINQAIASMSEDKFIALNVADALGYAPDSSEAAWLNSYTDEASTLNKLLNDNLIEGSISLEDQMAAKITIDLAKTNNLISFESTEYDKVLAKHIPPGWGTSGFFKLYRAHVAEQMYSIMLSEYEVGHKFTFGELVKISFQANKEALHVGLGIAGMAPVAGIFFDVADGLIYTMEMDWTNATLSFGSAIPVAGQWITGAKFSRKIIFLNNNKKIYLKSYNLLSGGIKFSYRGQLRKVLNITDSAYHAHHIIPYSLGDEIFQNFGKLIQNAAKSNKVWHINDIYNGIKMKSSLHLVGHSEYTNAIKNALNKIYSDLNSNDFNKSYDALMEFCDYLKKYMEQNPNFTSGQFVNAINAY